MSSAKGRAKSRSLSRPRRLPMAARGLAHPFLILILEGAPLLSRLLRQGGDFDLRELRMPSQVPRPVPAKNAGTRTGQPLDLRFYLERMGQPPTPNRIPATKPKKGPRVSS